MIKETACRPQEQFDRIERGIQNIFDCKNNENILDVSIHVDRELQVNEIEGRMQARATQLKKMETEDSEEDLEEVCRTLERISFINLTSNLHIFEII